MTTKIIASAVVIAALFAAPFLAQTEEELDALMKDVGKANGRVKKSTDMTATAKDAELMAKLLKDSQAFWTKHGKTDAVDWSKQGVEGANELAKAAAAGNAEGVAAATKVLGASCQGCHKVYRERLPDGSYKLKM